MGCKSIIKHSLLPNQHKITLMQKCFCLFTDKLHDQMAWKMKLSSFKYTKAGNLTRNFVTSLFDSIVSWLVKYRIIIKDYLVKTSFT